MQIQWHDPREQVPQSVAQGICRLLRQNLERAGYRGDWEVIPTLKKGAKCSPFEPKRIHVQNNRRYIKAYIRPGDRDTCWEVLIAPPDIYAIDDVLCVLSGEHQECEPDNEEEPQVDAAVGQIVLATITGRTSYGFTVSLPDDSAGVLPIEHIAGKYDKDDLNLHSIGDTVKVQVMEINPLKVSIMNAVHNTGTGSNSDVFTGQVVNGRLSLAGYSRDLSRRQKLLQYMEATLTKYANGPMPKDEVIEAVTTELQFEYSIGNTLPEVQKKSVGRIIQSLEKMGWLEFKDGLVQLTQLGLEELGTPEPKIEEPPITERRVIVTADAVCEEEEEDKFSIATFVRYSARLIHCHEEVTKLLGEIRPMQEWFSKNKKEITQLLMQIKD